MRFGMYVAAAIVLSAALFYPLSYLFGAFFAYTSGNAVAQYPAALRHTLSAKHETYLPYNEIPRCAIDGAVSVEDKRFFHHPGIDPIAIMRVVFQNFHNDHQDHGGSTVSQQLARLIIAEPRRQPSLLSELWSELRVVKYGLVVEHDFSKDKILELYLNGIYYGRHAQGFAQAAEAYFHTGAAGLSQAQCYYLTGLPQAPSYYGSDPQAAHKRYLHVLETLRSNGRITTAQERVLQTQIPVNQFTTIQTSNYFQTFHGGQCLGKC
jgi:membrane peptidoglycan carboxypeptidase